MIDQFKENAKSFIKRWKDYKGNERSEAQTYLNEFFQIFGLNRKDEEAEFEEHPGKSKKFMDLIWKDILLLEMKRPSEKKLDNHLPQARYYWEQIKHPRPKYIILCNFHEYHIYDTHEDLYQSRDMIPLIDLAKRLDAFRFMIGKEPIFAEEQIDLTRKATGLLAKMFQSLKARDAAEIFGEAFRIELEVC
ncbi:MAG: hypothetical protein IEMM0008_0347 [bacterium]|nr:MAG: hypothetical protein IEMM0008_0347 [bacterium]